MSLTFEYPIDKNGNILPITTPGTLTNVTAGSASARTSIGADKIVIINADQDIYIKFGGDDVEAASDSGIFCKAGKEKIRLTDTDDTYVAYIRAGSTDANVSLEVH